MLKIIEDGARRQVVFERPSASQPIGTAYAGPCGTCDDMIRVQQVLVAGALDALKQRVKKALKGKA